jgi:uncharacterized RmlC-like cupin family protein
MPMVTRQVSDREMQAFTARTSGSRAAWQPLMAPPGLASHEGAPVSALPGLAVGVRTVRAGETTDAVCHPARMHHVLCAEGEVDLLFGAGLAQRIRLERFDLVSLPAGVLHAFRGAGRLVVVTQIDSHREDRVETSGGADVDVAALMQRVSRARERVPYQKSLESKGGVPAEVMRYMAASRVYPIVAPPNLTGRNQNAPLKGLPGATVSVAECDAGDGPQPHAHIDTWEIFLCLEGRFDIVWGDRNEHRLTLEPLDLVAVPPTVMRIFKNVSDSVGRLMVIIQGAEDMADSIASFPEVAADVEERFGAQAVDAIRRVVKQSFDAIPGSAR